MDFTFAWERSDFDRLRDQIKAFRLLELQFEDDWAYGLGLAIF